MSLVPLRDKPATHVLINDLLTPQRSKMQNIYQDLGGKFPEMTAEGCKMMIRDDFNLGPEFEIVKSVHSWEESALLTADYRLNTKVKAVSPA